MDATADAATAVVTSTVTCSAIFRTAASDMTSRRPTTAVAFTETFVGIGVGIGVGVVEVVGGGVVDEVAAGVVEVVGRVHDSNWSGAPQHSSVPEQQ